MKTWSEHIYNKWSGILFLLIVSLGLVGSGTTTLLAMREQRSASEELKQSDSTFNKNYVIADPIFLDSSSLSAGDLQTLFVGYDSTLSSIQINQSSAANIINEASKANGINPKVVLALLQQRGNLVMPEQAGKPSSDAIEFALGYGCSDQFVCDMQYAGFDVQVAKTAEHLRTLYDTDPTIETDWASPGDMLEVGDGMVWPASKATFVLYQLLRSIESQSGDSLGMRDFWSTWTEELQLGDIQGYEQLATISDLKYPFQANQDWYVFQGYDTGTHVNQYRYAFDLVKGSCCNKDSLADIVAAATGSISDPYRIYDEDNNYLGLGLRITLADGYIIENDHLMNLPAAPTDGVIRYGEKIGELYDGHPGDLNHLHFQLLKDGQVQTLEKGYWKYPDNGPSANCGCTAHGEWSGTHIRSGCCGCAIASLQTNGSTAFSKEFSSSLSSLLQPYGPTAPAITIPYPNMASVEQEQSIVEAVEEELLANDSMPPTEPDDLKSLTHKLDTWSREAEIKVTWSPANGDNGKIKKYLFQWQQTAEPYPEQEGQLTTKATKYSFSPPRDGSWFVNIRAVDEAGNVSEPAHLGPFLIDRTPPQMGDVGGSGITWTNDPLPGVITWPEATDKHSGVTGYLVNWGEDEVGAGNTYITSNTYTPEKLSEESVIASHYLRVAPVDLAGNVGKWWTVADWRYDGASPSGSMSVGNGEGVVHTLPETLSLAAADEGSGVAMMRFSRDGRNWSEWQPYQATHSWQLDNVPETQVIFAQLQDAAGNISEPIQTTARVDLNVSLPSSTNYSITRSVMGMGGGERSSSSYTVRGTSGQAHEATHLSGGNYQVFSGFWSPSPGSTQATAQLAMNAGWNMVSSNVMPQDPQLEIVTAAIVDDIVLLKNGDGQVFWPALGINQIGAWNVREGYQVYMSNGATMSLSGTRVVPGATPIELQAGWTLASYLRDAPMPVDQALVSIASEILLVKNSAGQVYWPEYGINQIGDMQPGQGYQMYMTMPGTLLYPANNS